MEGERSRDDRARGFFEIRKNLSKNLLQQVYLMLRCFISSKSVFSKSIGRSRLWIDKPQNEAGKPLEAIRKIPSNKCKDVSKGKP